MEITKKSIIILELSCDYLLIYRKNVSQSQERKKKLKKILLVEQYEDQGLEQRLEHDAVGGFMRTLSCE